MSPTYLAVQILYRISVIGMSAYLISQLPAFRYTLNHQLYHWKDKLLLILVFGLLSVLGNALGIPYQGSLANNRIVGPIVAGLMGGPLVGMGAGLIGAIPRYFMGGYTMWAAVGANIVAGYVCGLVYNHYGARNIGLRTAFFSAVGSEIILKSMVLTLSYPFEAAWDLEKTIALPTMLFNSLAVAFFMYIVRGIFKEQEKMQAELAQQAMRVIRKTSALLRNGLTEPAATQLMEILYQELKPAAVAVTGPTNILAFCGEGEDHHFKGTPIITASTRLSRKTGRTIIAHTKEEVGCPHSQCPLTAVVDAPLMVNQEFMGSIKIFKINKELVLPYEAELIQGIADFLSSQLVYFKMEQQSHLLAQAEYNILKNQINPHFLFNTLATIRVLVRTNPDMARLMIKDLSDLLRRTLQRGRELITVQEELDNVFCYMRLQQARFGERLRLQQQIPEELLGHLIPVFTIQPLVENAVKHGLSVKNEGGTVTLKAGHDETRLFVVVEDDGVGMSPNKAAKILEEEGGSRDEQSTGIGLINVDRRLERIYNGRGGLEIDSQPEKGTRVTVWLPWQPESAANDPIAVEG